MALTFLHSGQTKKSIKIKSGDYIFIDSGAKAINATIFKGGSIKIAKGGTALNIKQKVGADIIIDVYSKDRTTKVTGKNIKGSFILSNGKAKNFIIYDYGKQSVYGTAFATIISGGVQYVYNGGKAINTHIYKIKYNYGDQYVYNGGIASNTKVHNGGYQIVSSGGKAIGTILNKLGHQIVSSGGLASATVVNNAGGQSVNYAAKAINTTVKNGGFQIVEGGASTVGGTARKTILKKGGMQIVGGYRASAISTIISSGGTLFVNPGGTATNVKQKVGGNVNIDVSSFNSSTKVTGRNAKGFFSYSKRIAKNFIIYKSGRQIVSGGSSLNTIISGGSQLISAFGLAKNSLISKGGIQHVYSNGKANATKVAKGGKLFVSQYGSAINAKILQGGSLKVDNGFISALKMQAGANLSISNQSYLYGKNNLAGVKVVVTGDRNFIDSLTLNKNTKIIYDLTKNSYSVYNYMLGVSTATQNVGQYAINVSKTQQLGTYNLSLNITQNNNKAYTINLANKKIGIVTLNSKTLAKNGVSYRVHNYVRNIRLTIGLYAGKTKIGTVKADYLNGTNHSDIFYGGQGNDTIVGQNGRDVVIYDKTSWGKDKILKTNGNLTILFKDLSITDITQKLSGTKMIITRNHDTKQTITIEGWNNSTHSIAFASNMPAFSKYLSNSTSTQITEVRNEVWKNAGLTTT